MSATDLDALDKLHAAATPGEWRWTEYKERCCCDDALHMQDDDCPDWHEPQQYLLSVATCLSIPMDRRNRSWIVALHNAYPALAAELRELRGEAQLNRGLIARLQIQRNIVNEVLEGTYESGWPSNEYECGVYELACKVMAENEALRSRVQELEAALSNIEKFGHGYGHGRGYTCADMARAALAAKEQP